MDNDIKIPNSRGTTIGFRDPIRGRILRGMGMKISLGIPRVRLSKIFYSALKFTGFPSEKTLNI